MKNTMKIMLALMIGTFVITACTKATIDEQDTQVSAEKILSFTAGVEGNTKTTINYSEGVYKINWCADDAIYLLDGTNAGKYTLTSGEGSGKGVFEFANEGEAVTEGSTVYAVYPSGGTSVIVTDEYIAGLGVTISYYVLAYKEAAEQLINEGTAPDEVYPLVEQLFEGLGLQGTTLDKVMAYIKGVPYEVLPSVNAGILSGISIAQNQVVAEGECVDPSTMLMVAKSNDGTTLNFKNVCSYVKITLNNPCTMVSITSRGGEYVAGNYSVNLSDSSNPLITCEDGSDTVTLTAAEGNLATGTYYIAVGVSALQNGLSIKYYNTTDGCFKASVLNTPFEFARNNVYNSGRDTDASVDGALWSIGYSNEEVEIFKANVVKVVINTGVPVSSKPVGAKILGVGTSIWSYTDSENVLHIETPALKIWGREGKMSFNNFHLVKEYEGLENVDVTELHDLKMLFRENLELQTLDLSSWNFVKITSAFEAFRQGQSLASLKLNDTFDISNLSGTDLYEIVTNVALVSHMCVISGITNGDIKDAFKNGGQTGWNNSRMRFEDE